MQFTPVKFGLTPNSVLNVSQSHSYEKEENSRKLFESQENIFHKLSRALSQSSCSTNIDDLEGSLLPEVDNSNFVNTPDVEDLNLEEPIPPTYGLRSRQVQKFECRKVKRRKVDRNKVESRRSKVVEEENTYGMVCETTVNDVNSQESISMLHECYEEQSCWKSQFPELMETCLNSPLEMIEVNDDEEMGEGWMVEEVPQGEPHSRKDEVEKSTQTDFSIFSGNKMAEKDQEARNHAKFIGSIVKFKAVLSSRKEVSKKKFWNVLKSISTFENLSSNSSSPTPSSGDDRSDLDEVRGGETVHTETIGYLLRTTNAEKVFLDTVKALLSYLEEALDKDLERIACCWKNSVYEMAVEMINQGLETESGIRKMVDSFLFRIVGSILRNEGEFKNFALESKTMFVINFCQSSYLCYDVINYIINRLMGAFRDCGGPSTLNERLNRTRLTNNSYFLFRILETLLDCFKRKIENEEVEERVAQETEVKNFHVLEMWKKHWHQGVGSRGTGRTQNSFKVTLNKWCDELDDVLLQCVKHIPMCSLPGERCGRLAKDILMICQPKVMGTQKQTLA